MQYRTFGRTGLRVSLLGLGTGGPSQLGQGSGVPEADAANLVRYALDCGVNLIDTAANYRDSEAILGRALRGVPRDRYVLCTKFGPVDRKGEQVLPAEALEQSLERSLQRLGLDHVDVFQLHGIEPQRYAAIKERFLPVLERAQAAGKCRFIGITETFGADGSKAMLPMALADDVWDTIMIGYNMLTLNPAEPKILPLAAERNVGVLVMCAVRRAIARPDKLAEVIRDLKARGKLAADALPDEDPLGWLVHDAVDSVPSAAYKYVAANPAVSTVLTGTANRAHFDDNVRAILGPPLPATDTARLQALFGKVGENLGN
jgi:aryl-alcohol dehydrogenase-like predicted oxidoreductase